MKGSLAPGVRRPRDPDNTGTDDLGTQTTQVPTTQGPGARGPTTRGQNGPGAGRSGAGRLLAFVFLGLAVAAAKDAEAGREVRRGRGRAGRLVRLRHPEGRVRGGQGLQARGVVLGGAGKRTQSAGDPRTGLTGNRSGESQAGGATADPAAGDAAASVTAERAPLDPPAGDSPTGIATGPTATGPTATGHLASGGVAAGPSTLGLLLRLFTPPALLGPPAHPRNRRHARHATTTEHLAHHLLALEEPHNEVVDLAHGDPRASSYASPPGSVEYLGVFSLLRGHRIDDGRGPVQVAVDRK